MASKEIPVTSIPIIQWMFIQPNNEPRYLIHKEHCKPLSTKGLYFQHFGHKCPGALTRVDPVLTFLYPVCWLSLQVKNTFTSFSCFGVLVQFCHFVFVIRSSQPQAILEIFKQWVIKFCRQIRLDFMVLKG